MLLPAVLIRCFYGLMVKPGTACQLVGDEQSGIGSSSDGEPNGTAAHVKPGDHASDDAQ